MRLDHHAVLELLALLGGLLRAALRGRRALVLENVLLRQQLAVALRTQRHPRVHWHDRLWEIPSRLSTAAGLCDGRGWHWRAYLVGVALDDAGQALSHWRGPNSREGWTALHEWAVGLGAPRQWGIEGAWNSGRSVAANSHWNVPRAHACGDSCPHAPLARTAPAALAAVSRVRAR